MSVLVPVDQPARDRIISSGVRETLFVEAGAGTGKTSTLVGRVVSLVTHEQIALRDIAAITFTEAAAAELRDRIRGAFEYGAAGDDAVVALRCSEALAELDGAAISTVHAFAQRILSEHPIEVAIPPRVTVLDDVQSTLAFEQRWRAAVAAWQADPAYEALVVRLRCVGVALQAEYRSSLKDVAAVLNANWDRLEDLTLAPVTAPVGLDRAPLYRAIDLALTLVDGCGDPDDKLLGHLLAIAPELRAVRATDADDDDQFLRLVGQRGKWHRGKIGRKGSWADIEAARDAFAQLDEQAEAVRQRAVDDVLAQWLVVLRDFTLTTAHARRDQGELEFHDLLVLARRLLRTSVTARRALHERYTRLLLDEFQDTDPIQIELAMLIAAGAVNDADVASGSWVDLTVAPGRVFVVGDPKQSIYRFRRADIALYQRARDVFGSAAHVALVQNFRTVAPIVAWINALFGVLMPIERPGQPCYVPLAATRSASEGVDHRVGLFGPSHADDPDAATLRVREAADVAAIVEAIRVDPWSRPVWHTHGPHAGTWRPARFADITVLIPSRQSLSFLEAALDELDLPYRVDTSTLVFDTPEIRDLLSIAAAIDDPSDELATLASLRSPILACDDRSLFVWAQAGGRWDYRSAAPSGQADGVIGEAMVALARWHERAMWCEPATLLEQVVRERDVYALALVHRRPRDAWRRVRFLIDQARRFSDIGGGHLRAFVAWADLQRREGSRIPEPLLPETDDDAVRIMTFHGAKGLEFPIVILSGLTTKVSSRRHGPAVHWGSGGQVALRLNKSTTTDNFEVMNDFETEMDADEKLRLLYVGATRARDHLFVSTHRKERKVDASDKKIDTQAGRVHATSVAFDHELCRLIDPVGSLAAVLPLDEEESDHEATTGATVGADLGPVDAPGEVEAFHAWCRDREQFLVRGSARTVWSATALAGALAPTPPPTPPPLRSAAASGGGDGLSDVAKVEGLADDTTRSVRRRGRGGTAFGRAVHAVLQFADPEDHAALAARAVAAVEAEALAGALAADVHRAVAAVLASPTVRAALAAPRHWRELAVTAALHGRVIEGFVDLLAEIDGELVLIDYKTDRVDPAALGGAATRYAPQLGAYALAIETATGRAVDRAVLVFAGVDRAVERVVALDEARMHVDRFLAASASPIGLAPPPG